MLQKDITIKNKTGLHARPASIFIKIANKYSCDIRLKKKDREIDAKSIIALLSLGAGQGEQVTLTTCGEDEKPAMEELLRVLKTLDE